MNDRPVGIDLFAGAGGMSLGFEQAGFDIAAAVEIDPVHCAAYEFNFPCTAVIPASVEDLCAEDIVRLAGLKNKPVDCVFGGAPCQGFSSIGLRVFDDPRNKLVGEFVRLVTQLNARTFVFENVKGLTLGRHREFLVRLVAAFEDAGYTVRLPWQVLNAAHYGVPQNRERLFLIGAKDGVFLPDYPKATNETAGSQPKNGLPFGPSVRDAIGDLPDAEKFNSLVADDSVETSKFGTPSEYAKEMRCLTNDAWHHGYPREWNPGVLTSSARTNHTEISRRRFAETRQGAVEPISRFFRIPEDGVSNTLRAGTDGARGAFTSPRPIHPAYSRCITVREMARLHGFPDWFRFNSTKWHGARQVGNAVPPPLARAVAGCIANALNVDPQEADEVLELGDPALLQFTVSQAAERFGVDAPISKRDRKSGAKKRRQIDIERERITERATHG